MTSSVTLMRWTTTTWPGRLLLLLLCHAPLASTVAQDSWNNFQNPYATTSDLERGWGNDGWFSLPGASRGWQLGVTGNSTEVGYLVRQVSPNSGAARAGINPGDNIVCVAGMQVGRVGNQVFDPSEEVARRADPSGRIQLLVQDGRALQLRPVRIQLNDQQGGLSGMLVITGGSVPSNAIATVQLENVDRPYFVVRNGQTTFRPPTFGGGSGIPFVLNYDSSYISPNDRYQIRAWISANGQTWFDTKQPTMVLTQGNPSQVQLVLTPVSYGTGSGAVNLPSYPSYDFITRQIITMYQRYLGRQPTTVELAAWTQMPDIQYRMDNLPLELMAAQEYFDRVGNNNVLWLRTVFAEFLGRAPSSAEQDQWMRRFAQIGFSRMELLRQLKQASGR